MMKRFIGRVLILFLLIATMGIGTSPAFAKSQFSPPGFLVEGEVTASTVVLSWEDNSTSEIAFKIERSEGGTNYTEIGTVGPNITTYRDSGLYASTKYYYRVSAVFLFVNPAYSNICPVTTMPLPPIAPAGLTATKKSNSEIKINWIDQSNNETGFKIERMGGPGLGGALFKLIGTVGGGITTYTNTGLDASTTYTYRVKAYNTGGDSAYSNEASANTFLITIIPSAPIAPTNLGVYVASSSSADLQWADRSSNETGFKIERMGGPAPGGLVYKEIGTVGEGTTDYTDTGLEANTMYTYRVRAANGFGNSGYSNEASGTTFIGTVILDSPNAPTNLVANGASSSIIDLQWADKATNETGFKIERMGGPGGTMYQEVGTVGANVTSYSNTGLNENTAYQYRVMAYNVIGNSAYTNIASAKTKALVLGKTSLRLYIDSMKYFVNDAPFTMDVAPMLKDNRTLLPIRYVVEPLGGDVKWDPAKQMVTVTLGSKTIILWVGNNMASVNGVTIPIDAKDAKVMPIIVWPGRTMVPMRFVTENLGCEVVWTPSAPKDVTVIY